MVSRLSRFGIGEVVGTDGPDRFTGKADTAFYGREGTDVFTARPAAVLAEDQFFLGGSGNDTYVLPSGTGAIVGDGFGSSHDRIRTPGISYNSDNTFFLEIDGRHLAVVDLNTVTELLVLDWLNPARQIETFEVADGTFQLGRDITARTVRSDENYLGDLSWEEAIDVAGEILDLKYTASEARQILNGVLARADELETADGIASPGDDVLVGSAAADTIDALAGDDEIRGLGGDDHLIGGAGADRILGGPGDDTVLGGAGNDRLFGNGGNDRIEGRGGDDRLEGGRSADALFGGTRRDILVGGGGDDRMDGGGGSDVLRGGSGDDTLTVDANDLFGSGTTVSGGSGSDRLVIEFDLDLTALGNAKIARIERIDLSSGASNSLTLNLDDVLAATDAGHSLIVTGDGASDTGGAPDTVNLVGDWTVAGDSGGFTDYVLRGATVSVEADVAVLVV